MPMPTAPAAVLTNQAPTVILVIIIGGLSLSLLVFLVVFAFVWSHHPPPWLKRFLERRQERQERRGRVTVATPQGMVLAGGGAAGRMVRTPYRATPLPTQPSRAAGVSQRPPIDVTDGDFRIIDDDDGKEEAPSYPTAPSARAHADTLASPTSHQRGSALRQAEQLWTILAPDEVLEMLARLQAEPTPVTLTPNWWKRILELQRRLGVRDVAHAADYAVARFTGIQIDQDELARICQPQVCKLVFHNGQPAAIVGLFFSTHIIDEPDTQAHERAGGPTDPPAHDRLTATSREASAALLDPIRQIPQYPVHISPDLTLGLEDFLGLAFVVLGKRRSGKSYTLGVIMEERLSLPLPLRLG